jgi:hypothetical protein
MAAGPLEAVSMGIKLSTMILLSGVIWLHCLKQKTIATG